MTTDASRPGAPQPSGVVEEAQSAASALAAKAQDAARGVVDQHKAAVAEQVDEVAQALDSVAEGVERVLPQAAPYVREAVSSVHGASETLRESSIDDLIAVVADFGRRQPAAFLGACTFGGFLLARFLKSSADRRRDARERLSPQDHRPRPEGRR
jgi:ABC-type transporter Mla subunit MlaD